MDPESRFLFYVHLPLTFKWGLGLYDFRFFFGGEERKLNHESVVFGKIINDCR
jgi:hypothetical protein